MMGEVKATGTCNTRSHPAHKQEIGISAVYCALHPVHFAWFRIAAQGMHPPTVGESSHLSWLHQGPMSVQRPIFQVSVDFVKLTGNTSCHFLHALICPSAPLLVPLALRGTWTFMHFYVLIDEA